MFADSDRGLLYEKSMSISYRFASAGDQLLFKRLADGVFDDAIREESLSAFLEDDRHHIVVAVDDGLLVGFVTAINYVHPDKPHELWINEAGVAPAWQKRGIAKHLLSMMLDHGRSLGCVEAWVLTEPDNKPANDLYRSVAEAAGTEPTTSIMHSFRLS